MNDLIAPVCNWLTSNAANLVISGGIALVGFALYFFRLRPRARGILAAIQSAIQDIQGKRDRNAFAQKFETIDAAIRKNDVMSAAWIEFSTTLLFPGAGEEEQVIAYSRHPADYFNTAAIIGPHLNLRFYAAVPNYLTGAGILGTFIGLAAGIYLASQGFNGDRSGLEAQLQKLLSGASLAFMTSIAGLVASIVFSVGEKRALHDIDIAIASWNALVEERMRHLTPERMAQQQVLELKRQSLQLERFNTDLAMSIAESLDTQLTRSMGPTLEKMLAALSQVAANKVETNEQVLRGIVAEFRGALSGATNTEMDGLKGALSSLQQNLDSAARGMVDGQARLLEVTEKITASLSERVVSNSNAIQQQAERTMDSVVARIEGAATAMANSLATSSTAAASQLSEVGTRFGGSADRVERMAKTLDDALEGYRSSVKEFTAALDSMRGTATQLGSAGQPIEAGVTQLRQATATMADALQQLRAIAQTVEKAAASMSTSNASAAEMWIQYRARFAQVDESLRGAFQELRNGTEALAEQVQGFVSGVDGEMAKSVGILSGAIGELHSAVEDLQDTLRPDRK